MTLVAIRTARKQIDIEFSMLKFTKSKGEKIGCPKIHGTGTKLTEIGDVTQMTNATYMSMMTL
jgi:hypothetical protein